jgi:hypothetical protein
MRAVADSVETAAGETVNGVVRSVADGKLTVATGPKGTTLRTLEMADLIRVKFEPIFDRMHRYPPLIDNDKAGNGRSLEGIIKLRAGFHRIVLPYWHGEDRTLLRLQYGFRHGSKRIEKRIVPPFMLFHVGPRGTETASPGFDKEGYRVPDQVTDAEPKIRYSIHRLASARRFASMADMLLTNAQVGGGEMDRIAARPLPEQDQNIGMLIVGYLKVPEDGEYRFLLSSDGGSQLYFGDTPGGLRHNDKSRAATPWTFTMANGGSLGGTLDSWKPSKLEIGVTAGRSRVAFSLPVERVAEIWKTVPLEKDDKIDRSNLSANADVVFARSPTGRIQRVPGRIEAIDGDSLRLQFGGESRKIAMQKVVGLILASERVASDADQPFYQVVETYDGMKLPGQLVSLDKADAVIRTLWGQQLTFGIDEVSSLTIRNGKAISLTEVKPARVEQVPYFDRLIPYRVNESLSGGPIVLRDGAYSAGISVHARTVLDFVLDGKFQRFRVKVGFQLPDGSLGDAAVRVTGDQKTLFDRPSLRGEGTVEKIDLDVTGIRTLSLVVDFGRREDVGDRVVWAEPTVVRNVTGPTAPARASVK